MFFVWSFESLFWDSILYSRQPTTQFIPKEDFERPVFLCLKIADVHHHAQTMMCWGSSWGLCTLHQHSVTWAPSRALRSFHFQCFHLFFFFFWFSISLLMFSSLLLTVFIHVAHFLICLACLGFCVADFPLSLMGWTQPLLCLLLWGFWHLYLAHPWMQVEGVGRSPVDVLSCFLHTCMTTWIWMIVLNKQPAFVLPH